MRIAGRLMQVRRSVRGTAIAIALVLFAQAAAARGQVPPVATPQTPVIEDLSGWRNGAGTTGTMSAHQPTMRPGAWPRLHLADPVARLAAGKALDQTWQRLARADCSTVLSGFTDQSGRPIEQRLSAMSVDLQTYLTMLVFIDGSRERACVTGVFGFTEPGSRVVRLCADELKRTWQQDPTHTIANFIHEMLHTLGLAENPPSSAEITRRVLARCPRH